MLDEAVLMPRSFVEQCCLRCTAQGARLWFSCNPEGLGHWFYQEWVQKAREKNVLRLSFTHYTTSAEISTGTLMIASTIRDITMSVAPPRMAATTPSGTPIEKDRPTASSETPIDSCAP